LAAQCIAFPPPCARLFTFFLLLNFPALFGDGGPEAVTAPPLAVGGSIFTSSPPPRDHGALLLFTVVVHTSASWCWW
jgi:hypothetical protein